jgi:NAD(P)-dependent dehydrogenase (short-subunit alcohol dehydrogenase family)
VTIDCRGKTVLVTGGTMGIGLETALAFASRGANCTLTYKWGTADEDEVLRRFADIDAPPPYIVRADAADSGDTESLLTAMRVRHERIDVFVSNVSGALVVNDLGDYSPRALFRSIEYSAWPLYAYIAQIKQIFGSYPRWIVGMSSTGPESYAKGYDFMAASKAVLEVLCRYLNYRLAAEDVCINIVRSRNVKTLSLNETFGSEFAAFAGRFVKEQHYIDAQAVANAVLALCSGWMNGVSGQVLTVDRGTTFFDNMVRLFNERAELAL